MIPVFLPAWVRIILVRRLDDSGNTIEVELSLPENIDTTPIRIVESISTLIEYLSYFIELSQFGFGLDLMEHDFLWAATIEVNGHIDDLFEVLVPPSI